MRRLVVCLILATGCESADPPRKPVPLRGPTPARRPADSLVIQITQPTLLSTFTITKAQVDSETDDGEAYADYTYYLGRVIPELKRAGIRVVASNDSALIWQDSLGRHVVKAADTFGIVYLFISPNGTFSQLRDGVADDDGLLDAVQHQFGLQVRPKEKDQAP